MFSRLFHRGPAPGLHVCLCCGAPFVCPVEWHALGGGEVWILLRCGQCQTWREVTATTPMAERFSAAFELAQSEIRAELRQLARQRLNDGR
ncbi:MAG: hypothetical protein QOF86_4243 [Baekduia sp.]|jgi:hypothetical protein|nr:hypothetical protein [Baekduia sp.]